MRLRDECLKTPSGSVSATMLLEGPYGQTSPIHTFENVVFIVGGSGITVAMSYLQEHAERTRLRRNDGSKDPPARTRQITLVWVAREPSMIREITGGQLQSFYRREDVRMRLFSTSEEEPLGDDGSNCQENPANQTQAPVPISYGRPSVTNEVLNAINDAASLSETRTAIVTCGPAAMADETRAAFHKALKEGKDMVEYFEEKFGYLQ